MSLTRDDTLRDIDRRSQVELAGLATASRAELEQHSELREIESSAP